MDRWRAHLIFGPTATSFIGVLAAAVAPGPAHAADWWDPATWTGNVVPVAGDDAVIEGRSIELTRSASVDRTWIDMGGSLDVHGASTIFTSTRNLAVGVNSTSSSTFRDGAKVETDGLSIGGSISATGTLKLSGGAKLDARYVLVAQSGTALMALRTGAEVAVVDTRVGNLGSGNGTLSMGGPGTKWINSGEFHVGVQSSGTVEVFDGATLITQGGAILGEHAMGGPTGTVSVLGRSSRWTSGAAIIVGAISNGSVVAADGALLKAPEVVLARDVWSTGTLTIGGAAGAAPASAAILDVDRINFGAGAGRVVFNTVGAPVTYAGKLEGGGDVDLLAGDLVLSGNSRVDPDPVKNPRTHVQAGSLTVNGILGGTVRVDNGAVLRGSGQVGSTTLGAGAVLAPGNSIGTLTVNGDLRFAPTSVYQVEVTPGGGTADRVNVTGTAYLAGSVVHVGPSGSYIEDQRYTVLSASQLNGRFAQASSNLAYLTPTLSYSADNRDVILRLTRAPSPGDPGGGESGGQSGAGDGGGTVGGRIRFADLVASRNARSAADAVETLPATQSVYGAALNLVKGEPQGFFSGLSGEAHASVTSGLINLAGAVRDTPMAHLRSNLGAGMAAGAPTAAAAPDAAALPVSLAQPAWAQIVGNWQRMDATGDTASVSQKTGGVFVGADHAVGAGWRVGGALGYTDSNLTADALASKADISSYSAVLYGGKAVELGSGKLNLMAGASYTWHDIDSKRQIGVGGLNQTLTAGYGASTTQLFTQLGYVLGAGQGTMLEPYAGVAWAGQRTRAFSESGGSAALSGESNSNDTATTTLGLRAQREVSMGKVAGVVKAGLGWRHTFGDITPSSRLAFSAGDAFTVTGAPIARDAALLEAGLDARLTRSATLGMAYAGQFGGGTTDQSAMLNLRWTF